MQRLLPDLPALDVLQAGVARVKNEYKGVNSHRFELINLLNIVKQYVDTQAHMLESEKRELLLAAYVITLERIEAERWKGQGSTMRATVYSVLGVKNAAAIDAKSRLILLNKFELFLKTDVGRECKIVAVSLPDRVKEIQNKLVYRSKPDINQIRYALPIEANMDMRLQQLVNDYRKLKSLPEQKMNQQRVFSAELLQAIAALNSEQKKESAEIFSPTYRIKMGMLLLVMREIGSTYSKLYQQCASILNIKSPDDIHPDLEKICLLAARNYLADKGAPMAIELYGRHTFGDQNRLVNLEAKLDVMVQQINMKTAVSSSSIVELSTLTMLLAGIGGVILAVPGYGSGQALGTAMAQTDLAVTPTQLLANNIHRPIYFALGGVGNYVGNFAATLMVNNTLQYAFGLAIESLGFACGAATGAMIGFAVFQVTPALLRKVCALCLDMHKQITDPTLADKVDIRWIQALMALPEDVLSMMNKDELTYATGVTGAGMFSSRAAASVAASVAQIDAPPSALRISQGDHS